MRHGAEHRFVGRIDDRLAFRALPFAGDVQLQVWILDHAYSPQAAVGTKQV
jgi:hypothetical protein